MKRWTKENVTIAVDLVKNGATYLEIANILSKSAKAVKVKLYKLGFKVSDFKLRKKSILKYKKFNFPLKKKCLNCNNLIKFKNKYCDADCHRKYEQKLIFKSIESGNTSLYFRNYKKYLIYTYGEICMECGWGKRNTYSGNIPIELEHIDGDSSNNSLINLKLLCPNCHSLTSTYKGMNKGNGRHYRRERYKNNKSY